MRNRDLTGALRGADTLIHLSEDVPGWTVVKGQILSRQGRFRQAIEQYSRAADMKETYARAYLQRAHAYRRIGAYELAVEDYSRLMGHAETADNWTQYQRATPLWILGRTDEAIADYERFRNVFGKPFYADARRYLILREQGRADEAERVIRDALREVDDPWLRRIFACLAGDIAPQDLVADAKTHGSREQACEAYYYAGEACLLSGRPAEARKLFTLCVQTGVEFDLDAAPAVPMNEYELARWRLESLPAPAP
jgi:tetratricopeptide (TPR) repeat protein